MSGSLLERLSGHKTLGAVPREQIEWVIKHGKLRQVAAGAIVTPKEGPVDGLHLVLNGHLTIHVEFGGGRRKVMEWRGGDVTGVMPYSRMVAPPGDVVAEEATELITVFREDLPEMIRECYELTAVLVHVMIDRARHFTSSYLHDEKLVSLGKLAAGLAHELNNPASAIKRSASSLAADLAGVEAASRALGAAGLTESQLTALESVREVCLAATLQSVRSPLEQADREETFAAWLEQHGVDVSVAESLAETEVSVDVLDGIASVLSGETLDVALQSVAAGISLRRLTLEIEQAASRVYDLVAAVKGFTRMDRATVAEPVDIGQGLANTMAILGSKARTKSVGVTVKVEPNLPFVRGFGGELNQVWSNLIDNALDAVNESGHVEITATRKGKTIAVYVIDDGPGIPAEVQGRIFDPFFTTKQVGEGTGLGLDIVRRLVQRHDGEIEVISRPGRTEFRVCLPVAQSPHLEAPHE